VSRRRKSGVVQRLFSARRSRRSDATSRPSARCRFPERGVLGKSSELELCAFRHIARPAERVGGGPVGPSAQPAGRRGFGLASRAISWQIEYALEGLAAGLGPRLPLPELPCPSIRPPPLSPRGRRSGARQVPTCGTLFPASYPAVLQPEGNADRHENCFWRAASKAPVPGSARALCDDTRQRRRGGQR
jgi:hypothetical protein